LGGWEAFRVAVSELTGGPKAPVGLALEADENPVLFAGLALTGLTALAPLIGPDLSYATRIFFLGPVEQVQPIEDEDNNWVVREYAPGAVGVVNYIIDRILGQADPWGPEKVPANRSVDANGANGLAALSASNAGSS